MNIHHGLERANDLVRLAKRAELLTANGGTILTVCYHGAQKVVDHYNIIRPVRWRSVRPRALITLMI